MKTTLKNLFNEWEDDLIGIDESTVCENTEISSDRIVKNAFSQSGLTKKKKSFGKAFKLTVIAAALTAVLVVGTTVFAQGQFQFLFHDYVNGDDSTPVYVGENQNISSDKVYVKLLGVTGDNTKLYSVLEITAKDGSDFVDDYANTYIQTYDEEFKDSMPNMDEMQIAGEQDRHILTSQYQFQDAKTIKAQIDIDGNRNGSYLTIQNHGLYFYHVDEIVYRLTGKESAEESAQIQQKIEQRYSPTLKENQFIRYDLDKNIYCIVTKTKSDFDYRISFELNYESAFKEFHAEQNIPDIGGLKLIVKSVHAEATGITIRGDYQTAEKSAVKINSLMSKQKLTVELNDGTIVKPYYTSLSFDSDESAEVQEGFMEIYYEFIDTDNHHVTLIPAQDMKSVTFNGVIFR